MTEQDTPRREPVNGPFALEGIEDLKSHASCGQRIPCLLWTRAIGSDGKPPIDAHGDPVPVRVLWTQQDGPADIEILQGAISETDAAGRASACARVGRERGVYRVRATLPDFADCADAVFSIYTDGVVFELTVPPVAAAAVGIRRTVRVIARDWTGRPVPDADLIAYMGSAGLGDRPLRGRKIGGQYRFSIISRRAGTTFLTIIERKTGVQAEAPMTFLPGPVRRLAVLPVKNPRSEAPYDRALVEVAALDRFGNPVPHRRVSWSSSAGSLTPVAPSSAATAAVQLGFGERASVTVTARCAGRTARRTVRMPDVYLRFLESLPVTAVGEGFKLQLEIFPPARAGVIKNLRLDLRQPTTAHFVSLHSSMPSVIPPPEIRERSGRLRLTWSDLAIPMTACQQPMALAQLEYRCKEPGEACLSVSEAVITTSHSPDETTKLNPGTESCRLQKWLSSKRLCLNICIIARNNALYELALEKAKQQVREAQELLNDNIGICCPDIDIKECYRRFSYELYKARNPGGPGPNGDELPLWGVPNPVANQVNPAQDFGPLSPVATWLLSQGRVQQCLTVFVVPAILDINGKHDGGYTINQKKWPVSVTPPAGPTIFLYDAASDPGTLAHELGHALMNTPQDHNDHLDDPNRIMNKNGVGKVFTKEECSRIFDNIGKYGGDCSA